MKDSVVVLVYCTIMFFGLSSFIITGRPDLVSIMTYTFEMVCCICAAIAAVGAIQIEKKHEPMMDIAYEYLDFTKYFTLTVIAIPLIISAVITKWITAAIILFAFICVWSSLNHVKLIRDALNRMNDQLMGDDDNGSNSSQ